MCSFTRLKSNFMIMFQGFIFKSLTNNFNNNNIYYIYAQI